MKEYDTLLVKASALPEVFSRVLYAKELIENGTAGNVSEAVKIAGISRSAFYKYKDKVFPYHKQNNENTLNISADLSDRAGVFSALTARLFEKGVNILTINQNHPVDGIAAVTLSVRTDNITIPIEELMTLLRKIDGVISVKII
ncbi:MAG: ACT domain-containing protein [Clostridia bacterium]|nr:ACT domain-containing protein [Clostridia bacterium]